MRVVSRFELRLVEPVAVWLQLAVTLDREELLVVGDHLVRRKYPLATLEQLRDVVGAAQGRGIRDARWALERVRAGTDSPMETRLRRAIVEGGLPEPVVGHTVRNARGEFVATPDLAYVDHKVAIEYEGDVHRTDRYTFVSDISRREQLEEAGWLVIRVVREHLRGQRQWLLNRIARALEQRHP